MPGSPRGAGHAVIELRGPEVGLWEAIPTDIPTAVRSLATGEISSFELAVC
jgi:hypothetical protein